MGVEVPRIEKREAGRRGRGQLGNPDQVHCHSLEERLLELAVFL
jgi:hypothetical protein